jgi:hypothetical protein
MINKGYVASLNLSLFEEASLHNALGHPKVLEVLLLIKNLLAFEGL